MYVEGIAARMIMLFHKEWRSGSLPNLSFDIQLKYNSKMILNQQLTLKIRLKLLIDPLLCSNGDTTSVKNSIWLHRIGLF